MVLDISTNINMRTSTRADLKVIALLTESIEQGTEGVTTPRLQRLKSLLPRIVKHLDYRPQLMILQKPRALIQRATR